MRILRRLLLALAALVVLAAAAGAGFWLYQQIALRRSLAKQAEEIAAHRAAQPPHGAQS